MSAADHLMTVHLVSMGCARNDVDSEELAARMEAGGFRLVDDPAEAETVVVNTCGFIEQAKKDSVDTLLAAADLRGMAPRPQSLRSGAWPSVTGVSSLSLFLRPTRCWVSTITATSRAGCEPSWTADRLRPMFP